MTVEDKYRHFNKFITEILILFSYQNKSWQVDRQAPRQSNSRSDSVGQTDMNSDRQKVRQTESQINSLSVRHKVRQTESHED